MKIYKISIFFLVVLFLTGILTLLALSGEGPRFSYFFISISRIIHNSAAISLMLLIFFQLFLNYWFNLSKLTLLISLLLFALVVFNTHIGLGFSWESWTHAKITQLLGMSPILVLQDGSNYQLPLINDRTFFNKSVIITYLFHGAIIPVLITFGLVVLKRKSKLTSKADAQPASMK